ncbi:UNVERIFIED_CONTAM: hypothetical protein K2H54_033718 [Gekko kuhli]
MEAAVNTLEAMAPAQCLYLKEFLFQVLEEVDRFLMQGSAKRIAGFHLCSFWAMRHPKQKILAYYWRSWPAGSQPSVLLLINLPPPAFSSLEKAHILTHIQQPHK